jgi:hypothetical protein
VNCEDSGFLDSSAVELVALDSVIFLWTIGASLAEETATEVTLDK